MLYSFRIVSAPSKYLTDRYKAWLRIPMLKGSLSSPSFNRPLAGKSSELSDECLCIIPSRESSGLLILGVDITINDFLSETWVIDIVGQHPKL